MPRVLSTAMQTWIAAPFQLPALFIQLTFSSSTLYLWSGSGSITWNGHTWVGVGALMGFSLIEDAANTEARNVTITLSGLDTTALPDCLAEVQLGLPVYIYLAGMSAGTPIATPVMAWAGRMDRPDCVVGPETFLISLNCETRTVDLNVPVDRRYTNPDQQMTYPGDLCFQFVDGIQEMTLYWMQQANVTNNI